MHIYIKQAKCWAAATYIFDESEAVQQKKYKIQGQRTPIVLLKHHTFNAHTDKTYSTCHIKDVSGQPTSTLFVIKQVWDL